MAPTKSTELDSADEVDGGQDAAPTAAGAVCVGGSRQTEVTDGASGTDSGHRAHGCQDAAPTSAGAVCVDGSRQTDVIDAGDGADGVDQAECRGMVRKAFPQHDGE